jgi:hypothetical protein
MIVSGAHSYGKLPQIGGVLVAAGDSGEGIS